MDCIFDIDGTLADCTHRLHYIQNKPKNWRAFFAGMSEDQPIYPTLHILFCLMGANDGVSRMNNIIFCTGRPEKYRDDTRQWLVKHIGTKTLDCPLYMRPDGDHRPDYIVKEELLDTMEIDGLDPRMVFEDRDQVVDMWRRNGLICYQVDKGAY